MISIQPVTRAFLCIEEVTLLDKSDDDFYKRAIKGIYYFKKASHEKQTCGRYYNDGENSITSKFNQRDLGYNIRVMCWW